KRINVSLDTMDPVLFERLSRRDRLGQVLQGIAAAREAGLKVKLNTVALKGLNEAEIPFLVEWAHAHGHELTLIEVMPLGEIEGERVDHYLPLTAVRDGLEARWTLTDSDHRSGGPARYANVAETGGRVGFITPLTNNFCASCNRIRVTATGELYACLGGAEKVDLRAALRSDAPDANLAAALDEAMRIKPERHHFRIERGLEPAQPRHMSLTGGCAGPFSPLSLFPRKREPSEQMRARSALTLLCLRFRERDEGLAMAVKLVFLGKLADLAGAPEKDVPGPLDWHGLLAALPGPLGEAIKGERV